MSDWTALDRFLKTDPRDVGCAEAMDMLHAYGDVVAAGVPAEERYPGVAAHLHACGPCGEDFEGLLAAIALPGQAPRSVRENRNFRTDRGFRPWAWSYRRPRTAISDGKSPGSDVC